MSAIQSVGPEKSPGIVIVIVYGVVNEVHALRFAGETRERILDLRIEVFEQPERALPVSSQLDLACRCKPTGQPVPETASARRSIKNEYAEFYIKFWKQLGILYLL